MGFYAFAQSQETQGDSDFQVWTEFTVAVPLSESKEHRRLDLLFNGVLRLGQNRLFPVDERAGIGLEYAINKNLSLATSYLYRRSEPVKNRTDYEHRLRFDATVSKSFRYFSLKDRNRFEYRIRVNHSDSWRYRNRLTLQLPEYFGKLKLAPFVSDEIYYDFSSKQLTTNDFYIGVSKKFNKSQIEIFLLRRDSSSPPIRKFNAIGINYKIRL
ncbi:MAG TPA: DUF2490 domain-containing protein [Pyrinomonadaceae bacterium]|jgi:hypothetical protein|nr:DUF2490 domain-containing protein [Pyrinomonadaceae bacterium]